MRKTAESEPAATAIPFLVGMAPSFNIPTTHLININGIKISEQDSPLC